MTEATRWVIIDDRDSRISYSGSWTSNSGDNFNSQGNFGATYLNTLHGTSTDASKLSFTFTGNAARIMGTTDLKVDSAGVPDPDWDCILDGKVVARQSAFPYTENNWNFCAFNDLSPGQHTVGLNVKTQSGRSFWIDQIQYRPGSATVQNEVVAATRDDADLKYSTGWGALSTVGYNTMVKGSTATFRFTGTGVTLWAMYAHELPHAAGEATYTVDGGSPVTFTIAGGGDTSIYNRKVFDISGLSQQTHTLVMTYTSTGGSTPLVISQLFVQGGTNLLAPVAASPEGAKSSATPTTSNVTPTTSAGAPAAGTPDIVPGADQISSFISSASSSSGSSATVFLSGDATATAGAANNGNNGAIPSAEPGTSGYAANGDKTGGSSTSKTPVGAIVGAVVGVLAIAILIFGIIWYRRRKRIQLRNDAMDPSPFSMTRAGDNNAQGLYNSQGIHNPQGFYNQQGAYNPQGVYNPLMQAIPPVAYHDHQASSMVVAPGSQLAYMSEQSVSEPSVAAAPGPYTPHSKRGPGFNSPYISNGSHRDSAPPSATTDSFSAPTPLIPHIPDGRSRGHQAGGSISHSLSTASVYTNSNTSSAASGPVFHQDSGVRLPADALAQIEEFPPTYSAR
ncbi:hypothetical protein DFP72DRAFT_1069515 [Ephemerocybe angulata]|uniref:Uncharacterized protein n=1 Tax=Ephemerocybe angulata TaxID=980116 RepID=A0A8H6HUN8_9AGAR|nr:hypothetical protein DFP72DRAFT_1069515 [Tulosesus angulatus]